MNRLFFGLFALLLFAAPAVAQSNVNAGMYEASPATIIDGQKAPLSIDSVRRLIVVTAGSAAGTSVTVTCSVTAGAPCKQEDAVHSSGDTGQLMLGVVNNTNSAYAASGDYSFPRLGTVNELKTGGVCNANAVINVAAGTTGQIIAPSGGTSHRICGFVLTADTLATTATLISGTGATCGTGTTNLTGAMRLQDEGNISIHGGPNFLFQPTLGDGICITAATGAVTGFITYAPY